MKVSVFVGVSLDGFIARKDGALDFLPVLIGEGIRLFGTLPHDVILHHIGTKTYAGGLVTSEYEVHGRPT